MLLVVYVRARRETLRSFRGVRVVIVGSGKGVCPPLTDGGGEGERLAGERADGEPRLLSRSELSGGVGSLGYVNSGSGVMAGRPARNGYPG